MLQGMYSGNRVSGQVSAFKDQRQTNENNFPLPVVVRIKGRSKNRKTKIFDIPV